ncbi:hypothetical protein ACFL1N_11980 [Thermodesulfobacteriota bacterium]
MEKIKKALNIVAKNIFNMMDAVPGLSSTLITFVIVLRFVN